MASSHLLIDAWRCSADRLDDADGIRDAVERAVDAAGATIIELSVHRFVPHGVTAVAMLAESHLALHTWPESGYFAADLFSCGSGDAERAIEILSDYFEAGEARVQRIERGPHGDHARREAAARLAFAGGARDT